MQAFLVSTGIVALAEIGDKTQLLALTLSAQYRRPLPIVLGILTATLLNHGLAGSLGVVVARAVAPRLMSWILALSFLAMAVWVLVPDKPDDTGAGRAAFGVFGATCVAFFLAEMGDKTQVATIALAAQYGDVYAVVIGTTLGMLLANVPVVLLGNRVARWVPMATIRSAAAAVFAVLAVLALFNAARLA